MGHFGMLIRHEELIETVGYCTQVSEDSIRDLWNSLWRSTRTPLRITVIN